jgi:phosphatidylinositol glycan class O
MLYRIFMPRMLMGVTVMMVVEIVAALVAIMGVRWSVTSVADIFGWEIS